MGVVVKGELFRGKYLEVNVLGRISWWRTVWRVLVLRGVI